MSDFDKEMRRIKKKNQVGRPSPDPNKPMPVVSSTYDGSEINGVLKAWRDNWSLGNSIPTAANKDLESRLQYIFSHSAREGAPTHTVNPQTGRCVRCGRNEFQMNNSRGCMTTGDLDDEK